MKEFIFRMAFLGFILLITYVLSWHVIIGLVMGIGIGGVIYKNHSSKIHDLGLMIDFAIAERKNRKKK